MKKLILQGVVGFFVSALTTLAFAGGIQTPKAISGIYLGFGGSWNTIDMDASGINEYVISDGVLRDYSTNHVKNNQAYLAPMAQLGYWAPINDLWLWGIAAEYKYLNYNSTESTTTALTTVGGNMTEPFIGTPLSLSTHNFITSLQHEFMLLVYFGMQYDKGYFYLGLGPALFTLNSTVWSTPEETAPEMSKLIGATASINRFTHTVSQSDTIWGGAVQLGYNYYFTPTWFLGCNYTYTVTGDYTLTNTVNNGLFQVDVEGPYNRYLSHTYSFTLQEIMLSINKVFEV